MTDSLIGARIRSRRIECGKRLVDLAGELGVTPQQVHRYERGINPVPVSALLHLSALLGVSLCWFLADVSDEAREEADLVGLWRKVGKRVRAQVWGALRGAVRS